MSKRFKQSFELLQEFFAIMREAFERNQTRSSPLRRAARYAPDAAR